MLKRYATIASAVCGLTLTMAAPALADNVSIDTTGADSYQKVTIDNSSDVVVSNTNVVSVQNTNVQKASSGDVTAKKNTEVGGLSSGPASNNNTVETTVSIKNPVPAEVGLPVGGAGNGSNVGNAGNGGQPGPVTSNAAGQGNAGQVLGAATGGLGGAQAILPVTGPSEPVDVSALRAAWHPAVQAPTVALVKGSSVFTSAMLLTATLLSLLGGLGSAWYAKRREERV